MKTGCAKLVALLTAGFVASQTLGATAWAGVNAMSGRTKLTYSRQEVIPVGDVEGHILQLGESSGPNTNTGAWDFMADGTCGTRSFVDLVRGTGTQTGYFTCQKGGDKTVAKYDGTVTTVLTPEGKPFTTFAGSWKYVTCTGKYAGCTGQGVYAGHFESKEIAVVDFKGILVQ